MLFRYGLEFLEGRCNFIVNFVVLQVHFELGKLSSSAGKQTSDTLLEEPIPPGEQFSDDIIDQINPASTKDEGTELKKNVNGIKM